MFIEGVVGNAELGSPKFAVRHNPILLLQAHYTTKPKGGCGGRAITTTSRE